MYRLRVTSDRHDYLIRYVPTVCLEKIFHNPNYLSKFVFHYLSDGIFAGEKGHLCAGDDFFPFIYEQESFIFVLWIYREVIYFYI